MTTTTFREVLGHVPTSVAVVTTADGAGPVGMTVGSFTSISLDPPLVGFFADAGSATLTRVGAAGRFCVNVLTHAQHHLCRAFAGRAGDRFRGVEHSPGGNGAPRLSEAVARIECDVDSTVTVGDHVLVVGRVTALDVARPATRPLVFFRGTLCDLDRRTVPSRGVWQHEHYAEW
ncbi:flavin reductase family protein [Actinoplanes sp. CA-054009]